MKRFRVSVYSSVEVDGADESEAVDRARDEVLAGLPKRDYEFSAEEIEPPVLFYRAPLDEVNPDDKERRRTPTLNIGWEYGFIFMQGGEIWGIVTALTDALCTIERSEPSGDPSLPLNFDLIDVKVVYSFGAPYEPDEDERSLPAD